jgi:catechol 2,3-dioxygenase-like lactoylglutathione lyase family enzyme
MSSVRFQGSIYIGVRNMAAALAWYKEKLDLRESPKPMAEEIGDVALVSRDGDAFIAFGEPNPANVETQILAVGNTQKAREWLAARGVKVGPIQVDRQGTPYFEMRDLENNMIEFCEEP